MLMHVKGGRVDCEPSFFFFRFNEGSARELDGPRKERDYTLRLGEGAERKIIF